MVYLVVGPPLCAALAILFSIVVTMLGYSEFRPAAFDSFPRALLFIVGSVLLSYVIGGLQAALVGLGIAVWKWRVGSPPIAVPLIFAVTLWPLYLVLDSFVKESDVEPISLQGLLWLANHLIVAAICWWIDARRQRLKSEGNF